MVTRLRAVHTVCLGELSPMHILLIMNHMTSRGGSNKPMGEEAHGIGGSNKPMGVEEDNFQRHSPCNGHLCKQQLHMLSSVLHAREMSGWVQLRQLESKIIKAVDGGKGMQSICIDN